MTTRQSESLNKNRESEEKEEFLNPEQEPEGSAVDVRIDHLTEWADEFFSGSAF